MHPPWFDFNVFVDEIPPCPDESMSIDRIDNSKGYIPGNIRWSTNIEQANNKTNNKLIRYRGQTKTLAEWCREMDRNYMTVKSRLAKGWTTSKALTEPTGKLSIKRAQEYLAKNSKTDF